MKLFLLVVAIVLFLLVGILALAGGAWATGAHLEALLAFGLASFAGSALPLP